MQAIIELADFITKNKVKQINIIGEGNNKKKKVNLLFEKIRLGEVTNDEEAFDYLFTEENKNNKAVYRKIKSDLKKKLINTCFFIDTSRNDFNDHQKAYYECYRYWAAQMILLGRGASISSRDIAFKVLKPAIKYEFVELIINITRKLIQIYSIEGDLKKYNYYKKINEKYIDLWQKELLAENLYRDLSLNYAISISSRKKVYEESLEAIQQLRPYLTKESSYRFILMYGLIEVLRFLSIHDYVNTIKVCKEIINRLKDKPFLPKSGVLIFTHKLVVCYTQLRDFKEGEKSIHLSLSYSIVGTTNWFISMQLYFILAQHSQRYNNAFAVFVSVTSHHRFSTQRKNIIEVWKIYEAYLHFLIKIGKIDLTEEEEKEIRKFKLGKFINEVPTYSKDKRGMNIPILVIQILFYLQQKEHEKTIDRIETIEKYCSRYLGNDNSTYRSNCFIKMLIQIPKTRFHRDAVIRKTKKYQQKLEHTPIALANQAYEIEVIPYEDLWELILGELSNRIY